MADIAARVTTARLLPDDSRSALDNPVSVLVLSAEDGAGDTIRPRLEAAGADLERVQIWHCNLDDDASEMLPSLPEDIGLLANLIQEHEVALVTIDPLMAYLSANTHSFRDQDVRRALAPLAKVGEATGAAIVLVRHLNKAPGGAAIYRGGDSIGIIGAARSGLLVAKHPDDETRRVLASTKSNLGPPPPSLAYRLVGTENDAAAIRWEGIARHSADELLSSSSELSPERQEIITYVLDADSPVGPKDIADALGKNEGTVRWHLSQAVKDGQVERIATGMYAPPNGYQQPNHTNGVDTGRLNPVGDVGPLVTLERLSAWDRPGQCRECTFTLKTPEDFTTGYCDYCRTRGKDHIERKDAS
jgi:hypothetical protein